MSSLLENLSQSTKLSSFAPHILVVPPFECAWIEDEHLYKEGKGCLSFEVKGEITFSFHIEILSTVCLANQGRSP